MTAPEILKELVRMRSVSGEEGEIANWVGRFLLDNGFGVEFQEVEKGRSNVFARKGDPKLLFFGHMDTVPPLGSWTRAPFSLTVEGDRAYGLGTWDMKGGLACILEAVRDAPDAAVLFSVDEEEISKGSHKALERREFFRGLRGIVSAEAGNAGGTYGGVRHISYARQGRLAFSLSKELSAGHAATAKGDWVEWICEKARMPEVRSRLVIRNFHATSRGLSMPDRAELEVDALVHPDEKDVDFARVLSEHFGAEAVLKKRETPYLKPYTFKGHAFIGEVGSLVEKEFGAPSYHIGSSVGDENALAELGIPIAIVGPEGRNEHRPDEWVSVKSLGEITELYKRLLGHF